MKFNFFYCYINRVTYDCMLSCHAFQSESTLYNCLNVKELVDQIRRHIWCLSDNNRIRTHNHLVHKQTLNHLAKLTSLAKWLSAHLWTKGLWVRVQLQLLKLPISRLLWARSFLTFKQLQSVDSLWSAYVTWQEHTVARSQMSLKIDVF